MYITKKGKYYVIEEKNKGKTILVEYMGTIEKVLKIIRRHKEKNKPSV